MRKRWLLFFWRAWSIRLIVLSSLSVSPSHSVSLFRTLGLVVSCFSLSVLHRGSCHAVLMSVLCSALSSRRHSHLFLRPPRSSLPLIFPPSFLFFFSLEGGVCPMATIRLCKEERERQRVANDPIVPSFVPSVFHSRVLT